MSTVTFPRVLFLLLVAVRTVAVRGRGLPLAWLAGLVLRLWCSGGLPRRAPARCPALISLAVLLLGSAPATSQSPDAAQVPTVAMVGSAAADDTVRLTLAAALERAVAASEQLDVARAAVVRARADRYQSRSAFLPQLSTTIGYTRTLKSEFESLRMPAGEPGDSAAENPFAGLELPFGQANRYDLGVTATQTVFAGGQLLAQHRITGAGERSAQVALGSARAQLELDVTRAYYDAALGERLLRIAESSLAQAEETLRLVSAANRVGEKAEFEVLRAQVARDNQRPQVIGRRSDRDLAHMRLKQLLNLPLESELRLEAPLPPGRELVAALDGAYVPVAGAVADTAAARRAAVRQAAEAVSVRENQARIAFAQRLPSLALTTQYGRVGYPRAGLPAWDQFRANWTVGVQLQLPVFTGGRIRGAELRAEADVADARARLAETRELAALDARSALEQLRAATSAWEASAGTVEQASKAYRIAELRYREGLSTQLELSDARLLLQQAEANRAVAARDLEVARAVMRLLPDLPIGAAQQGR